MSAVEATLVLMVVSLVTGTLAPVVRQTTDEARLARATTDLASIRTAIEEFAESTTLVKFTTNGRADGPRVDLLVGAGDIPVVESAIAADWARRTELDGRVDTIDNHLLLNAPRGSAVFGYERPAAPSGLGWRGAYLSGGVDTDPWGHRYMVNVKFMVATAGAQPGSDVFVYSAGPDGRVETPFAIDGAVASGDDLLLLVFKHSLAVTE
ncbi:MAG: hypothetical protein HYS05_18835 [Acidobacteria bacterium]|nr:hypothetical protein [Acidobacteriota bacterium]